MIAGEGFGVDAEDVGGAAQRHGAEPCQEPHVLAIDRIEAAIVDAKVVEWRRDIHANPELSNREFRTAALVADHLRGLGATSVEEVDGIAETIEFTLPMQLRS